MDWISHIITAIILYLFTKKFFYKKVSLSLILLGSTLFVDFDHILAFIARKTIFKFSCSPILYTIFETHNWMHTLIFIILVSYLSLFLFEDKKSAFWSIFLGMFLHLSLDWVFGLFYLEQGKYWFWPIFYKRF